jgi:hypothetical protein
MFQPKKRFLSIALALIMTALLFSTTIFALPGDSQASYDQVAIANAPTISGEFTVYLAICTSNVSGTHYSTELRPVTMGSSGLSRAYFVSDVLAAAAQQYGPQSQPSWQYPSLDLVLNDGAFNSNTNYLSSVQINGTSFESVEGYSPTNGWMFRINDKFPKLNQANRPAGWSNAMGPAGASIAQAYVQSGDIIDLYFAEAGSESTATKYVRFENVTYSYLPPIGVIIGGQLYSSTCYYDQNNNWYWMIENFASLANTGRSTINTRSKELLYSDGYEVALPSGRGIDSILRR